MPRIETQALQWALLMQGREAAEARAAREAAGKESRKGGRAKGAKAPRQVGPMEGMVAAGTPLTPPMTVPEPLGPASSTGAQVARLPSLEELLAERGARRAAEDIATGFEGLE